MSIKAIRIIFSLGCLLIQCCGGNLLAQAPPIIREIWSAKPALHQLDEQYKKQSAVLILDRRRVEYVDVQNEKFLVYRTVHRIVRVNDDYGIESFNKVRIAVPNKADIIDLKARTILPNGKEVLLENTNIREVTEKDGNTELFLALEGIEKGCEIEYYVTYKRRTSFFGTELLQNEFPVIEARIELITPERLSFETKEYHGHAYKTDTTLEGKRMISISANDLPAAGKEKFSFPVAHLQRIEFRASYVATQRIKERYFTWNECATFFHTQCTNLDNRDIRRAEELVAGQNWAGLSSDREKIIAVESYVKRYFSVRGDLGTVESTNIEKLLQTKLAGYFDVLRLYGIIFKTLNVPFNFVLAGNREDFELERAFENWDNADAPLLFFPNEKKFLAPTRRDLWYPLINPTWAGTNGLFCKSTTIGTFNTIVGELRPIVMPDLNQNVVSFEATVKLDPGTDSADIGLTQKMSGYFAAARLGIAAEKSRADTSKNLKALLDNVFASERVLSAELTNASVASQDSSSFVLKAKIMSGQIVERAGDNILLKIGQLTGTQEELYSNAPRRLPVQLSFPFRKQTHLSLVLPKGFVIKNPEDLRFNVEVTESSNVSAGFVSSYVLENGILKIEVVEQFRKIFYPLNQYEGFRKVINAGADFNKVVLVLVRD